MEKLKSLAITSFKYFDSQRCFGGKTDVIINPCFTLDEVFKKLVDKVQDVHVTEVVLQCGFNDVVRQKKRSNGVFATLQQCIQLLKEVYPNAVRLVGEILPHPTDQQADGGISTINYLSEETCASLDGDIRYVQHPVCRSDNELYDSDGIHLNIWEHLGQTRQETIFYKKDIENPSK